MGFSTQAETRAYAKGRADERKVGKLHALGAPYGGAHTHRLSANMGAEPVRKADPRFRSFCERYVVTRSHLFRTDPEGLAEDTWNCILDAKRVYNLTRQVSYSIREDDSGSF